METSANLLLNKMVSKKKSDGVQDELSAILFNFVLIFTSITDVAIFAFSFSWGVKRGNHKSGVELFYSIELRRIYLKESKIIARAVKQGTYNSYYNYLLNVLLSNQMCVSYAKDGVKDNVQKQRIV